MSMFVPTQMVQEKRQDTGADPGFQVRGYALKKIAPSGGRHENCWAISCEKSRFYTKKSYFSSFRGGARRVRPPLDPPLGYIAGC